MKNILKVPENIGKDRKTDLDTARHEGDLQVFRRKPAKTRASESVGSSIN